MTYRIHGFQYGIAVDIHVHGSSALNTSVHVTVSGIGEAQIFFLECHHGVSNGELNLWQIVRGCRGREDVALVVLVVLGARNSLVDSIHKSVINQAERGTSVHDGSVTGSVDSLAIDGG